PPGGGGGGAGGGSATPANEDPKDNDDGEENQSPNYNNEQLEEECKDYIHLSLASTEVRAGQVGEPNFTITNNNDRPVQLTFQMKMTDIQGKWKVYGYNGTATINPNESYEKKLWIKNNSDPSARSHFTLNIKATTGCGDEEFDTAVFYYEPMQKELDPPDENDVLTINEKQNLLSPSVNLSKTDTDDTMDTVPAKKELVSKYSKILVLFGGSLRETGYIASIWKHSISYLFSNGGIAYKNDPEKTIDDYPLLIIPSGALSGLGNNLEFKQILENYVNNGGTIICLGQQRGNDFSVLPDSPGGYGWNEDQSCYKNAVYLENYHPILSAVTQNPLTVNFDGYFTSYPLDSDILLRRTKNGYPAMLKYEYGNGEVIISSQYTDWAYKDNQSSSEGLSILRDIFAYYKNRERDIIEIEHGETGTVDFSVTNNLNAIKVTQDSTAVRLIVSVLNPDKNMIHSEEFNISLNEREIG
ncbi:hypothetical protein KAU32_03450, partial [bacterium]|nr:hypothetical protein [bacterium]